MYAVQNVPGDGNCFFHCVSLAFFGNLSHSHQLRQEICSNIAENWFLWEDTVAAYQENMPTRLSYVNFMLSRHGFATTAEIMSAADVLQCKFNVWLEGSGGKYILQTFSTDLLTKQFTCFWSSSITNFSDQLNKMLYCLKLGHMPVL